MSIVTAYFYTSGGRIVSTRTGARINVEADVEESKNRAVILEGGELGNVDNLYVGPSETLTEKAELTTLDYPDVVPVGDDIVITGLPEATVVTWPDSTQTIEYSGSITVTATVAAFYEFTIDHPAYVKETFIVNTDPLGEEPVDEDLLGVKPNDIDALNVPADNEILKYNLLEEAFEWVPDSGGPANTDELAEGATNLYYTDARVLSAVSGDGYIKSVSWGEIGGTLSNQADLQLALDAKIENLSGFTTTDLSEGTNLYFTDARAVTAIKADLAWNATDWDTAFSWGDHATAGYLTSFTETDPTVPSHVKSITTTEKANWNTAFGWGDWSVGVDKAFVDALNVDADTLDGLDSTSFLRSDATDTATDDLTFTATTLWQVSSADPALQRVDARDDATNFARLHWYGISDTGGTSNFRHAWYDGTAYIDVTASAGTVTFGGNLAASGFSGNGSGLTNVDAATLDGAQPSVSTTDSSIVQRDSGGDTNQRYAMATYFNTSHSVSTRSSDTTFYSSSDNYIRKNNASGMRASLNVPDKDSLRVVLGGGFDAGQAVQLRRIGDVVFMQGEGVLTHVSSSGIVSTSGIIPAAWRPLYAMAVNCIGFDGASDDFVTFKVTTTGSVVVQHNSGASQTDSFYMPSVTYLIA